MELLRGIARVLRAGKAEYAAMITREMSKPLPEAEGEIEKCAWNCDFYADAAPGYLADQKIGSSATQSGLVFDPLGVVLASCRGITRSGGLSASPPGPPPATEPS